MSSNGITQEQLSLYHKLAQREKIIKDERKALRLQLVQMIEENRYVQPGRYSPKCMHYEARVLTKRTVTDAFGESEYEYLRDTVTPVDRVTFTVIDEDDIFSPSHKYL